MHSDLLNRCILVRLGQLDCRSLFRYRFGFAAQRRTSPRLRSLMVRNYASNTLLGEVADDYMERGPRYLHRRALDSQRNLLLLEIGEQPA